jgi:predicted nucleic acid-binding protein
MLYIDSNVFVYGTINTPALGENARSLLLNIQLGKEKAETSALTFDEVFWAVKKHSQEAAIEACQALLNFPNLEIVPFNRELALLTLQVIKENRLTPRDAIHAATAISDKADVIVSTDAHFDKLRKPKRQSLETYSSKG